MGGDANFALQADVLVVVRHFLLGGHFHICQRWVSGDGYEAVAKLVLDEAISPRTPVRRFRLLEACPFNAERSQGF